MLPAADVAAGRLIEFQYGPTLSPDESKILFVPTTLENPRGSGELYEYDLASGGKWCVSSSCRRVSIRLPIYAMKDTFTWRTSAATTTRGGDALG